MVETREAGGCVMVGILMTPMRLTIEDKRRGHKRWIANGDEKDFDKTPRRAPYEGNLLLEREQVVVYLSVWCKAWRRSIQSRAFVNVPTLRLSKLETKDM